EDDTPPMWRSHPPDTDREDNAKETFVPAPIDHRSPWLLFADPSELKERLSYKFYRRYLGIPKNSELSDAKKVQEYIDNEHADTTYDPKYKGAYDDRKLEPGDLSELNSLIQESPWTEERMEKVYDKLYDGCREHAEEYSDLRKDLAGLNENVVGKPSPKMKKQIKEVEKKIDENWEWFKSFDRRVYLLYVQMAALVKPAWRQELVERYQFQIEVQKFYEEARDQYDKADAYLTVLFKVDPNELPPDFPGQVIQVLRDAWKGLKKIIHGAREINLPAMKNFEEGENLAEFILPGKMVPEPPLSYVKGVWIDKLFKQLHGVRMRCFRLHTKSLGGILAMQEKIAAAWIAAKTNVDAGVVNLVSDLDAVQVVDENDLIEVEMMPTDIHNADHVEGEHVPKGFMFERLKLDDEPAAEEPITVAEVVEDVIEAAEVVEEVPASPFVLPGTPPAPAAAEPALAVAAFRAAPQPASPPSQANPFEFDLAQGSRPATPPSAGESTELFDLELSDSQAKAAKKADPTDVVFSLDADEIAARSNPAPKPASSTVAASPPRPAPPPAPPVPAAEVFSLDPEPAPASTEPPGVVDLGGDSALASPPRSSASAAAPARPAFGSGSGVASSLSKESPNGKPTRVKIKRPAVRITFVKPGEKSPLAR
ncbi:MAG TPA: hypothetical protein VLM40_16780, partial [Gemmata sp.]|nr:hypothetical protein [Gemmata sp.]